jgi:pentose-5-phosphate-3-epimerase
MKPIIIARSMLSANVRRLGEDVRAVDQAGADWVRIDVMDGRFVPNISSASPIGFVEHVLHLYDAVLVMAVNPGFGGQTFLPRMLPKIRDLGRLCVCKGLDPWIAVDGGLNENNAALAVEAGADVIVAGSTIFGSSDYAAAITRIRDSTFRAKVLPNDPSNDADPGI